MKITLETPMLLAGAVLCAAPLARASTLITFDSLTPGNYQNSFTGGGWIFSAASSGPGARSIDVEAAGLQSSNASDRVVAFGFTFVSGSPLTSVSVRSDDGGEFKLESLSLGDGLGNAKIQVQGFRDGVATAYAPVQADIFNSVHVFNFSGWNNLDEIRFTNYSGASDLNFDLDDMTIATAVPEPASTGLLGLAALGFFRRRR